LAKATQHFPVGSSNQLRHRQITVDRAEIHVVDAGPEDSVRTFLFLHGWPQDWSEFEQVQALAAAEARAVAIDLPGIGGSKTVLASGAKSLIAPYIAGIIDALALKNVTLVGHDAGGMIAYACLRRLPERLASVAIISTVIPGLPPWEDVIRNPRMFHFALHAVPDLPERLVLDKQGEYFDFFFQAIAAHPDAITPVARQRYAKAYASPGALKTGFDWYRAFPQDVAENRAATEPVDVPLLYVRGAKESAELERYLQGFREQGITHLSSAVVADSGHFIPEEQPRALWECLRAFAPPS
jgi:pimeloyl-ACP methyl ester carboxylesterase